MQYALTLNFDTLDELLPRRIVQTFQARCIQDIQILRKREIGDGDDDFFSHGSGCERTGAII